MSRDEIHDAIMQFSTESNDIHYQDDILRIMNILDKLNDKVNDIRVQAYHANNVASCLANGIQPD